MPGCKKKVGRKSTIEYYMYMIDMASVIRTPEAAIKVIVGV